MGFKDTIFMHPREEMDRCVGNAMNQKMAFHSGSGYPEVMYDIV